MIFLWLPIIAVGLFMLYIVLSIIVTVVRHSEDSFDKLVVLHVVLAIMLSMFIILCLEAHARTGLG